MQSRSRPVLCGLMWVRAKVIKGGLSGSRVPHLTVVLMEPKFEGNVGAIARSMANFRLEKLVLVNPCPLGAEAYKRAKHGRWILESARLAKSLTAALDEADLVVGTTGIPASSERSIHRQAIAPRELASKLAAVEGNVAMLFGREDYGLYNDVLDRLDILVNVPCSPKYPVLNVSQAATVLFYELYRIFDAPSVGRKQYISGLEMRWLAEAFRELLETTGYPKHKRRKTEVLFRRVMGRALPTRWEFHALMGVLRRASKAVRRLSGSPGPGPSS